MFVLLLLCNCQTIFLLLEIPAWTETNAEEGQQESGKPHRFDHSSNKQLQQFHSLAVCTCGRRNSLKLITADCAAERKG